MKKRNLLTICTLVLMVISTYPQPQFRELLIDPEGPESPWGKCVGDLNNDGLTDLIIGGYVSGGLVYYTNPDWQKKVISGESGFSTDIEVYDMDGDRDLDLFCVRQHTLEWFENPSWNNHLIDSVRVHDLELSDFNHDGKIDMVSRDQGEFGHHGDQLFFYVQISPDKWKKIVVKCDDGEGLKVFDLNSDGFDDVIINGTWFENTGRMDQWNEHLFSDTWKFKSTYIDVGDLDGDGREDIVLTPSELKGMVHRISWFKAPKDPTSIWPEHMVEKEVEAVHHFVGLADFDMNGNLDIATAEMLQGDDPDEVKIYYNKGYGNAWGKAVLSESGSHSMRIVDIDRDGDLDLFGANHQDSQIKLWVNQAQKP